MSFRRATRFLKPLFVCVVVLAVCGFAWSQDKDQKDKNEKREKTPPAKSAAVRPQGGTPPREGGDRNAGGGNSAPTGQGLGDRGSGNNGGNNGGQRGDNAAGSSGSRQGNGGNSSTVGQGLGDRGNGNNAGQNGDNAVGNAGSRQGNSGNSSPTGQGLGNRGNGNNGNNGDGSPSNGSRTANNRNSATGQGLGNRGNGNNNNSGNNGGRGLGGNANVSAGVRFSGPSRTVTGRGGVVGKVDGGGRITSIRGNGFTINRGGRGVRTVITTRPDHTRLVSTGGGRGFVERPLLRGGRPYVQRTYVINGRSYARVYRGAYFHGVVYYHYVPPFYFAPAFYGWAYRPWGVGISFNWGWGPWFGFNRYYFTPYPVYVDSSQWLTDYVISQQLQDAYDSGYAAGQNQGGAPPPAPDQSTYAPLSPELKQAISDQVRNQLAVEQAQQAPGAVAVAPPPVSAGGDQTPDALDPKTRTFIVSAGLTEQLPSGAECPLVAGDVLTRIDDTPDANNNVRVLVSSSQANDCPAGSQLMVGLQDLQDMFNSFRERMDAGLNQLSQNQGKNGIPSGPAASPTQNPDGVAQADPNAQSDLQQQQQDAQQAEQDVQNPQ